VKSRATEFGLWAVALLSLGVTGAIWWRTFRSRTAAGAAVWPAPSPAPRPSADSLAILTSRIVDGDVFRLDRKPAAAPYRVARDSAVASAPAPAPPPKPVLSLVGIVGGPPWAALVDGIPAHDGTMLVHASDTVGALRVTRVTSRSVTITGLDTVWHLTTKEN